MIKVKGFKFSGISCGLKKSGKKDLGLISSENICTTHAVFTKNKVVAAPLIIGKEILKKNLVKSIIVNSGNANSCTGKNGIKATNEILKKIAKETNLKPSNYFPSSTGIIGVDLDYKKINKSIPNLVSSLDGKSYRDFAEAITTTDQYQKYSHSKLKIGKNTYNFLGIAKGAGMIHPNMATMLCFFLTDLRINKNVLRSLINEATSNSFNSISVDGEMSTNDTVIALSNGAGGEEILTKNHKYLPKVKSITENIFYTLAKLIVKDGEGATKFCRINVVGAKSERSANQIARKIANSLLFKTALYGSDPNWGRIMSAIGASELNEIEQNKIDISIGNSMVVKKGIASKRKGLVTESRRIMKKSEVEIKINLNIGKHSSFMLTNDIGNNYINFNSFYTT